MDRFLAVWATCAFCILAILFAIGMGFVDVGAADPNVSTRNVNSYGGVLSAVTAVGSDNASLLINDIQTIRSGNSVTFAPNTQLTVTPGSGLSVEAGAQVYFHGPIVAGAYPIVYGNGTSVFAQKAVEGVFQKAWTNSGTSEVGIGRNPDSGYKVHIAGSIKTDGPLAAVLPNPIKSDIDASKVVSGASSITSHVSGTSLVSMNTFVYQGELGSTIYGLPPIPTSGVTTPYAIFTVGPAGGGITVFSASKNEPFIGFNGSSVLSGTSYLAIPPGLPLRSATIFGVVDISGTSKYWFVQATPGWVAGD